MLSRHNISSQHKVNGTLSSSNTKYKYYIFFFFHSSLVLRNAEHVSRPPPHLHSFFVSEIIPLLPFRTLPLGGYWACTPQHSVKSQATIIVMQKNNDSRAGTQYKIVMTQYSTIIHPTKSHYTGPWPQDDCTADTHARLFSA